jgi:uncharacterized protein (UPF0335 family)
VSEGDVVVVPRRVLEDLLERIAELERAVAEILADLKEVKRVKS